jgi:hypothetical protein
MILHTFKPGIAYGLSTEALHVLDAVNYDRSTQDVREGEHVELFQTGSWLTGKGEKTSPVLLPLTLLQTELKKLGLDRLVLLPARIKPANRNSVSIGVANCLLYQVAAYSMCKYGTNDVAMSGTCFTQPLWATYRQEPKQKTYNKLRGLSP